MQLSKHFTLAEAIKSAKARELGVSNEPDSEADLATMQRTAIRMEEIRSVLGGPIIVSSWYRSSVVNNAVGGVPDSQHKLGEAVDFVCPAHGSPAKICATLRPLMKELGIDQLILEPTWVHVSFNTSKEKRNKPPRNQYLNLQK